MNQVLRMPVLENITSWFVVPSIFSAVVKVDVGKLVVLSIEKKFMWLLDKLLDQDGFQPENGIFAVVVDLEYDPSAAGPEMNTQ